MRRTIVGLVALALAVLVAPGAWAHVEVAPEEATRGSVTTFTFSVPNEEDAANTVAVEVVFPENSAFTTITPEAKDGWTAAPSATSAKWSGGTITAKNEEKFSLTLGPLPNGENLTFKVLQTYNNGDVARWIDIQTGSAEPEHPAPVVKLTGDAVVADTTTSAAPTTTPKTAKGDTKDDEKKNNVAPLVFGALVLAGIGDGIAIGARRRSAKP
jgi:uncharacterized protein YcnI